jgi:hypothetical protein
VEGRKTDHIGAGIILPGSFQPLGKPDIFSAAATQKKKREENR